MRFAPESTWGCNAGLGGARKFLEGVAQKHKMSQADVWTLAAAAAIEKMGGPAIPWTAGRVDAAGPTAQPDGRLPNADMGCPGATIGHIRDIFGRVSDVNKLTAFKKLFPPTALNQPLNTTLLLHLLLLSNYNYIWASTTVRLWR
jgi:hypothetical protein